MKKEDLKYGNVVELRNGYLCLLEPTNNHSDLSIKRYLDVVFRNIKTANSVSCLENYRSSLTNIISSEYDIIKVYEDYTLQNVLWERKEKPVLTEDERVILKNFPKHLKWIVRDEDGELYVYENEPSKSINYWSDDGDGDVFDVCIFEHLFQFIKWEDEEPYKISELIEE